MATPETTATKGPETFNMTQSPKASTTPASPAKSNPINSSTSTSPTEIDSASTNFNNKENDSNNSSIYTTAFPGLPPNNSPSHAHILSLPTLSNNSPLEVSLQDAIATTLYHSSPSLLSSFLDPTIPVFKAVFGENKGRSNTKKQLVIWRKGVEVLIGTYTPHTSPKRLCFSHVAGYLIGYDGCWYLRVTAGNAWVGANRWTDVWTGKFECLGGVERMEVETDEEGIQRRAKEMAREVLGGEYWRGGMDVRV